MVGAHPRLRGPAFAILAGAAVLLLALTLGVVGVTATLGTSGGMLDSEIGAGTISAVGVSALARAEIPLTYLRLYLGAAAHYGLDWAILAGIGKVECDHGRDPNPACTHEGAINAAGAGGPMQFLASTWAQYGVSVRQRRSTRPLEPCGCDLWGRQLPAGLGRSRQLRRGDLCLQPRELVRRGGRELGGKYSEPSVPIAEPSGLEGAGLEGAWVSKAPTSKMLASKAPTPTWRARPRRRCASSRANAPC